MSFNRENIVWQTEDKLWHIGFYEWFPVGNTFDEDYDPEWDVDYNYDRFVWVSTSHTTPESAMNSYPRNPGSYNMAPYGYLSEDELKKFALMVINCLQEAPFL